MESNRASTCPHTPWEGLDRVSSTLCLHALLARQAHVCCTRSILPPCSFLSIYRITLALFDPSNQVRSNSIKQSLVNPPSRVKTWIKRVALNRSSPVRFARIASVGSTCFDWSIWFGLRAWAGLWVKMILSVDFLKINLVRWIQEIRDVNGYIKIRLTELAC